MNRNPKGIVRNIEYKNGSIFVKKDTTIEVPSYFRDKNLYIAGKEGVIRVMGSYAVIQGNDYSISEAPCFISLTPEKETTVLRNDVEYIELFFPKGSMMIKELKSIHEKIPYVDLFVKYMLDGKIPWYLDYEDVVELFLKGSQYAGLLLESRPETLELLHSLGARAKGTDTLIRETSIKNPKRKDIDTIAVSNVAFGAATTITKITGSYQSAGLDRSLVTKTTKLSATEKILRDIE